MKRYLVWIYLIGFGVLMNAQGLSAKDWEYQESGTTFRLTAVSFVDRECGWAVGENGDILATLDGGTNWKDLNPYILDQVPTAVFAYPRTCHFRSVYFLDRANGWVAGEMTLLGVEPEDIFPIPTQFGIILHTRDGGLSWECQYPCKVWTDISSEVRPFVKEINDIFFLNARQGWAVGDDFYYLATKDGGNTWEEMPIGFWAIPEIRQNLTATRWISPQRGWVAGYQYDMFYTERRNGFIAQTEDGGKTWQIDPFYPVPFATIPSFTDLEIKSLRANTDTLLPPAWAVGEEGTALHLMSEGWEHQGFPWPISLPLPQFNATEFVDDNHGWIVGYRAEGYAYDDSTNRFTMTIFHTADGGQNWKHYPWHDTGELNDIALVGGTDAWAVGDRGVILHYANHAPETCRVWAEPQTVYAGEPVDLYVSVKDLDGPSDIQKVTVDARSIGGGMVVLEPAWQDYDDRRCVLFQGEAVVSPLAAYGAHRLPVEVIDYDGARTGGEIDLFVIASWVEIKRTWAIPNPVAVGGKVLLAAEVDMVAPKGPDGEDNNLLYNKVEKVTVDITELLGVDCPPGSDCIIIVGMTDPDGDGIYTYVVAPVTGGPGNYKLPVWAVDTLGHQDRAEISVRIVPASICEGDFDGDGDVDGSDLAVFAADFGRTDCPSVEAVQIENELGVSVDQSGEDIGECMTNFDCMLPLEYCAKPIGHCEEPGICAQRPDICPLIFNPVCGCDGFTYRNACEAVLSGVAVAYPGECREPCKGDFDHDGDVDGSDLAVFAADFGRTDCP